MPIDPELLNLMLANAPAVAVLLWLTYRLEQRLSACFDRQSEILDRLLALVAADEAADS